jgi:hypothetical protein
MRTPWLVAFSAGLAACGGGPGSFDGKVASYTLDVKDVAYVDFPTDEGVVATVVLADSDNLCDAIKGLQVPKNLTSLVIGLGKVGTNSVDYATTGKYTLEQGSLDVGGLYASAEFGKDDASCNQVMSATATSGSVEVTSLTRGKSMAGKFDLTFAGGSGTGDFDATFCDASPSDLNAPATCR